MIRNNIISTIIYIISCIISLFCLGIIPKNLVLDSIYDEAFRDFIYTFVFFVSCVIYIAMCYFLTPQKNLARNILSVSTMLMIIVITNIIMLQNAEYIRADLIIHINQSSPDVYTGILPEWLVNICVCANVPFIALWKYVFISRDYFLIIFNMFIPIMLVLAGLKVKKNIIRE